MRLAFAGRTGPGVTLALRAMFPDAAFVVYVDTCEEWLTVTAERVGLAPFVVRASLGDVCDRIIPALASASIGIHEVRKRRTDEPSPEDRADGVGPPCRCGLDETLGGLEEAFIRVALAQSPSKRAAARILKLNERTLRDRMWKRSIETPPHMRRRKR